MTITAIPTRTVGSLGPTKENRRAVSDPYRQIDANEYNLLADCAIHAITQLGVESSPAWDSIQGILTGGDTFWLHERFISAQDVAGSIWGTIGVAPALLTTARGGARFTLDAAKGLFTNGDYFTRSQKPYVRCRITLDGNPDFWWLYFVDTATGNEGYGVTIDTTGALIRGFTRTAGVNTYTTASTWSVSTEFVLEMWIASNKLYVSKNGAAATDCGTVVATAVSLGMASQATGAAGKVLDVRNLLVLADWSA